MTARAKGFFLIGYILVLVIISVIVACGDPVKATGQPTAMEISSLPGVRCFAILSSDNKAVGGNCIQN